MITPLLFLDTETSGLKPDVHTIWELAWKIADHDTQEGTLTVVQKYEAFVPLLPTEMQRADQEGLKIGRFVERFNNKIGAPYNTRGAFASSTTLRAACRQTKDRTGQIPHLVGAVPSFDHNMLCMNWLGWPGFGEGSWHYHLIDVEVLAAGHINMAPPYKSEDLCEALGVTVSEDDKHTAMGDVNWAMRLYAAVYHLTIVELP